MLQDAPAASDQVEPAFAEVAIMAAAARYIAGWVWMRAAVRSVHRAGLDCEIPGGNDGLDVAAVDTGHAGIPQVDDLARTLKVFWRHRLGRDDHAVQDHVRKPLGHFRSSA